MLRTYADYLAEGLAQEEHERVVQLVLLGALASELEESEVHDASRPDRGLPPPLLALVEGLRWFVQAANTGVAAYFRGTELARQAATHAALRELAPQEIAARYACGMSGTAAPAADTGSPWCEAESPAIDAWLAELARDHMDLITERLG